jgi:hypothetical protein
MRIKPPKVVIHHNKKLDQIICAMALNSDPTIYYFYQTSDLRRLLVFEPETWNL